MINAYRHYYKHYTKTTFSLPDGTELMFLELPWRNNEIGKSCIPYGTYVIDRDHTGRQTWYKFRNEETAPRTSIEIHPAYKLSHLEGCLAPCYEIRGGERTSNPIAVDSIKACEALIEWFGEDSWVLKLQEAS